MCSNFILFPETKNISNICGCAGKLFCCYFCKILVSVENLEKIWKKYFGYFDNISASTRKCWKNCGNGSLCWGDFFVPRQRFFVCVGKLFTTPLDIFFWYLFVYGDYSKNSFCLYIFPKSLRKDGHRCSVTILTFKIII